MVLLVAHAPNFSCYFPSRLIRDANSVDQSQCLGSKLSVDEYLGPDSLLYRSHFSSVWHCQTWMKIKL